MPPRRSRRPCCSPRPTLPRAGAAAPSGPIGGPSASLAERLGPAHPEVGPVALALATALQQSGRNAEAVEPYRRALAIFTAADGPHALRPSAVAFSLGVLLDKLRRPAEAEPALRLAVDALHAIHGGDHPEAALAMSHLATVLRKLRRRDEARDMERRVRAVRSRR